MDPFLIGSVAAPIVGAGVGKLLSLGDEEEARKAERLALAQYLGLDPSAVELSNVEGPSAMEGVHADPRMEAYQMEALRRIANDASTVGMTAEERAAMAEAQNDAAAFEQGQRGAIMDNARARGIGGSGFELAAQLGAQQGSAQRANRASMAAAAQAEARRRQAQSQLLSGAGQVRGQAFGEAADRAQAHDALARWRADTANRNAQWRYGQQAGLADAKADQYGQQADSRRGSAQETQRMWGGIGQGVGEGLSVYGRKRKKDEEGY